MNDFMQSGLLEATRLTQAGRLMEATAAIQRALRGEEPLADTPAEPTHSTDTPSRRPPLTLDGIAVRVDTAEPPHAKPTGGRFINAAYTGPEGTRSYKLYVPSSYQGEPLPLIVMLHGCTQGPDDFATGTGMNVLAEEEGFFVAYPAQAQNANVSKCWNWFNAAHQQRGQGEPALIAGITQQITSTYRVDLKRIYVAGLSAGGAMAAVMGTTYPDLYAAIGVHSGLPHAAAHDMPSALAAMQQGGSTARAAGGAFIPTIVFHGDRDTTVHPRNGAQVVEHGKTRLDAASPLQAPQVQRGQVPAGHAYTRTSYPDASGCIVLEHWEVHGAGHAWLGGSASGSYTDPKGPDATREMMRFFREHSRRPVTPQ